MIVYRNLHNLLSARMTQDKLSLRSLGKASKIDYMTLWRLLQADNNKQVFMSGKGRKGKVIMNITAETIDKLCRYLKCQPGDLLGYAKG